MIKNKTLFIDFDSTFIKLETLDELAKLTLKNDVNKDEKIKKIISITNYAMTGKINFSEALNLRLKILKINKENVLKIILLLSNQISDSINSNFNLIKSISNNIWIVSGGFKNIIAPIVKPFGIKKNKILANDFIFNKKNHVVGCDIKNDLFKNNGKIIAIKKLNILNNTIMIGDGYTDFEVYKHGAVKNFIYFSENVLRKDVLKLSKFHARSFNDVLKILKKL